MNADLRVFKNKETLSRAAAEILVALAAEAITTRGRFLTALSGGGTPAGLFRMLASDPHRGQVDWLKTYVFWGDERCVPPDDEGSNYYQAMDILLRHVPILEGNILRVKGELEPARASDDYAQTLKRFADPGLDWPCFDLALLGMGEDGHTASLFPGSEVSPNSPTLAVTAHYQGRPANRVTLTPLVLNAAHNIMFLVTGANKAASLDQVLNGEYRPKQFPAQRIHPTDGKVIWLVDEAAASTGNL